MAELNENKNSGLNIHPDNSYAMVSILSGNKGVAIAVAVVVIIAIIGISALISFNSTSQYEGMLKKVELQTEQLRNKMQ